MPFLHSAFVVCLFFLLLSRVESSPIRDSLEFQRSFNQPSIFTAETRENYLGTSLKDSATNARNNALLDVRITIAQVQKILESDHTLPRLTRGEIEDLFEEITKEEYEKSIKAGDISRAKHMRALMLVLPYHTNNTSYDELQELYNRPPVTKVISSEPKAKKKQKIVIPSGKVEIVNVGNQYATTYKPTFRLKPLKTVHDPTTYHPSSITLQPHGFVSSTTPTSFPIEPTKSRFSSHYNAQKYDFSADSEATTVPSKSPSNFKPMDSKLEDILDSLGFSAQSQSKKRFKLDDPPSEELNKRMLSSTIKQDYSPESLEVIPSALPLSISEFRKGLGIDKITPRAFSLFKRIPDLPDQIQPDLETYLTQFGIFPPSRTRSDKALESVISDRIDTGLEESKNTYRPQDTDEEDFKKLQKLLNTLKELQQKNASLSEEILLKLNPRHYNLSETLLSQGPNPLLETELDITKNEIKRQTESPEPIKYSLDLNFDPVRNETVSTESPIKLKPLTEEIVTVTPEVITTTEATTTTEEPPRNNIEQLGESFAGGLPPIEDEEPLPPPRRNGFYFLLDINKFLEVGEDPDKVVVRFDPKVGDPSRFIPVNVP